MTDNGWRQEAADCDNGHLHIRAAEEAASLKETKTPH